MRRWLRSAGRKLMQWARILAHITGTVDQQLLLRNDYLFAENRILNPPSCTSKINKLGNRGGVCSKSFFGIRCFALESLWNSSKDFRTRCCKINELTLTRNQAVRGSKPQPEPGTRTLPRRSRRAYRKRDEVSCSRRLTVRSQRLRSCEVQPELRLKCDACPGAGYANGAEIPRLLWLPPIIRSV
jgi:hypothetical protein